MKLLVSSSPWPLARSLPAVVEHLLVGVALCEAPVNAVGFVHPRRRAGQPRDHRREDHRQDVERAAAVGHHVDDRMLVGDEPVERRGHGEQRTDDEDRPRRRQRVSWRALAVAGASTIVVFSALAWVVTSAPNWAATATAR